MVYFGKVGVLVVAELARLHFLSEATVGGGGVEIEIFVPQKPLGREGKRWW